MSESIIAAIASLRTAGEIAATFLKARDIVSVQSRVIELQALILSAQQGALASQSEMSGILEEMRSLRGELEKAEGWRAIAERYQLIDGGGGAFAYRIKSEARGADPDHLACSNCMDVGRRSVLQNRGSSNGKHHFYCQACKSNIQMPGAAPDPDYRPTSGGGEHSWMA